MRIHIFSIPACGDAHAQKELNNFLSTHRILTVEKQLVERNSGNAFWSFVVEYLEQNAGKTGKRQPKVDYKEVLNPDDFTVYSKLRSLRKQIASEEGVQVFMIFTNEQLADMVRNKVSTISELQKIRGVGQARADKYGERFLTELNNG